MRTVKKINLALVLVFVTLLYSCGKDDGSGPSNEIEITYSVEVSGVLSTKKVYGTAEYSNGDGTKKEEVNAPWEVKVSVPRGHNLYFRVTGTIAEGKGTIRATAVDKANGNVVFTDEASDSHSGGLQGDFDFTIEGKNLGN